MYIYIYIYVYIYTYIYKDIYIYKLAVVHVGGSVGRRKFGVGFSSIVGGGSVIKGHGRWVVVLWGVGRSTKAGDRSIVEDGTCTVSTTAINNRHL